MNTSGFKRIMAFFAGHRGLIAGTIVWALVLFVELFVALYDFKSGVGLPFMKLFLRRLLLPTLPFIVLFAVHDLVLAPMLVVRKKTVPYILCTFALLGVFSAYILYFDGFMRHRPEDMAHHDGRISPENLTDDEYSHGDRTLGDDEYFLYDDWDEEDRRRGQGHFHGERPPEPPHHDDEGRPVNPSIFKIILAVMMLGVNLGAKYYSRYAQEKRRLEGLERENLEYRLECLRYQINPHFFMNTLNNIHALVDISPEKAKESIVELSRLMRHVLYDSSGPTVDLAKEIDFLRHYLYLMRLRYTDSVRIDYSFPDGPLSAQVPPLLMATIVENAFKHGVSYESESFIRLSVSVDGDKVIFRCVNSLAPGGGKEKAGGVGLENISKRLSLLYGDRYVLHLDRRDTEYDVLIVLPSQPLSGAVEAARQVW